MGSLAPVHLQLPEADVADPAAMWAGSGAMALTGRAGGPALLAPPGVVIGLTRLAREFSDRTGLPVDGPALLGERAAHADLHRRGDVSCGGSSRLLRAADGWVAVSLARDEDVALVPAWLEAAPDDIGEVVGRRAAVELVARAALVGLPVSRVGESRALSPFAAVPLRGKGAPGQPSRLVVDLSSLWAGPLCGQLLGQAGFRVIKVESITRPDGARLGPPAFFDLLHAGQESAALDLASRTGRAALQRLVDSADVVIEASRPRALDQLGIGPSDRGPAVWVSITGYGREGDAGNRVAFGDDAAAAAGLVVCDETGPCFCADAAADPATGLYAAVATLAALAEGGRWLLDIRLAGVASWLASAGPAGPAGGRYSGPVAEPHARRAAGHAASLGAHTDAVLAELLRLGPACA